MLQPLSVLVMEPCGTGPELGARAAPAFTNWLLGFRQRCDRAVPPSVRRSYVARYRGGVFRALGSRFWRVPRGRQLDSRAPRPGRHFMVLATAHGTEQLLV